MTTEKTRPRDQRAKLALEAAVREALSALISDMGVNQRAGDEPLEVVRRLTLHARRDFFAEEF